jgi:hypothetical protein
MTMSDLFTRPAWAGSWNDGRAGDAETPSDLGEWQRVWLRAQGHDWRTLALVPADDGICTYDVANVIAKLALANGEFIHVADVRDLRMRHVDAFIDGTRWDASQGDRIVFATRSASNNPTTVRLARAADYAILCVSLGSTSLDCVRDAIEQIGRKHFLGSLLVRASRLPGRRQLRRAPKDRP